MSATEFKVPFLDEENTEFSLRVCGLVESPLCAAEAGDGPWSTSACLTSTTKGWGSEASSIGDDVLAPKFSYIDATHPERGVSYTLDSAMQCGVGFGRGYYNTIVSLQCGQEEKLTVSQSTYPCIILANVTTPVACTTSNEQVQHKLPSHQRHHKHHRQH